MEFFFADDSRQDKPSRHGMGRLVGTGGIHVPGGAVGALEKGINAICDEYGFPSREDAHGEFKWSPGSELWMRSNLISDRRQEFFVRTLTLAADYAATAIVMLADVQAQAATRAPSPQLDVTRLLLERVERRFRSVQADGVVVVDQPSGGKREERAFLADCLETLAIGTQYVKPERIVLNVLATPSKFCRLLQLADVVTSCTTAAVSGESVYSPSVFDVIKRMLLKDGDRTAGIGLKIHPDIKYVNLYHWLLGDTHFRKGNVGHPLPLERHPYAAGPDQP